MVRDRDPHGEVVLPHADCRDTQEGMEVDMVVILEQMMEVDEEGSVEDMEVHVEDNIIDMEVDVEDIMDMEVDEKDEEEPMILG